jgi:hypothetical protein
VYKDKLKLHAIRLWELDGGNLRDPDELTRLEAALEWRFRLLDRLEGQVQRGVLSLPALEGRIRGLSAVTRQLETELIDYRQQLNGLVELAVEQEIEQSDFQERLDALSIAIMVLALLIGLWDRDVLIDNPLYNAAKLIIEQVGMGDAVMDEDDLAKLTVAMEIVKDWRRWLPEEVHSPLAEKIEASEDSSLGADIYSGEYDEAADTLASRLSLWVITALAMYTIGQLNREDDPLMMWVRDPMKESCTDCLRLDGQVRSRRDWKSSGWWPQSSDLECGGWECGCRFVFVR